MSRSERSSALPKATVVVLNVLGSGLGLLGTATLVFALAYTTSCVQQRHVPVTSWDVALWLSVPCIVLSLLIALRSETTRRTFRLSAYVAGGLAVLIGLVLCLAFALPSAVRASACDLPYVVRLLGLLPALAPALLLVGSAWALETRATAYRNRLAIVAGICLVLGAAILLARFAF